ncbi:MAG: transcriptional repressor NrdR [Solirubrobacterales bacterium]|nr:transcriptional repressor NrdR [Solirubrobacterales bacterium]
MECPSCGAAKTSTLETRRADDGAAVRRRRRCPDCDHRFTTFERREPDPLYVIKRGDRRQRFDPEKLRAGLTRAAHKRPVRAAEIEAIVGRIERAVVEAGGELDSERIGEICLEQLRELDGGAYLQYAGTLSPPGSGIPQGAGLVLADPENPRNHRTSGPTLSVRKEEHAASPTTETD